MMDRDIIPKYLYSSRTVLVYVHRVALFGSGFFSRAISECQHIAGTVAIVVRDEGVSFGDVLFEAPPAAANPVSIKSLEVDDSVDAITDAAGGCAGAGEVIVGRAGTTGTVPILGRDSVSVETAEASALKLRGMGRGGGPIAAADVKRSVSFWIMARSRACWSLIRHRTTSSRPGLSLGCLDRGVVWTADFAGSLRVGSAPLAALVLLLPGLGFDFDFVFPLVALEGLPILEATEAEFPSAAGECWCPFPWGPSVRGAIFTTVSCSCCCAALCRIRKLLLALVALRCSVLVERLLRE